MIKYKVVLCYVFMFKFINYVYFKKYIYVYIMYKIYIWFVYVYKFINYWEFNLKSCWFINWNYLILKYNMFGMIYILRV